MEGFRPFGIPLSEIDPVILLFEEYESIRLTDYLGLTHEESAVSMKISRPTFTRICEKARRTIAQAFIEGRAIFIEGGNYHTDHCWYRCEQCLQLNIHPSELYRCKYCLSDALRRLNEPVRQAVTPETQDYCICPDCQTRITRKSGRPCRETSCMHCGKPMMREGSYHHKLYTNKNSGNENSITDHRENGG
jgi:predicted DNA-binding protein (UPF0251 family)